MRTRVFSLLRVIQPRFIAAIILLAPLVACTSWRVEEAALEVGKTSLAVVTLGALPLVVNALRNIQTTDPNH